MRNIELKNNYFSSLNGPILFTAPHSEKIYRGGEDTSDEKRLHEREAYTSTLCLQFTNLI